MCSVFCINCKCNVMKKFSLLVSLVLLFSMACRAQDSYRISGKVNGMTDGTFLLMGDEGMTTDTLGVIAVKNGVFVFSGTVNCPMATCIVFPDGNKIPLILENADFMINISDAGALIKGGKQQELLGSYTRISQDFIVEQSKMAMAAQQPGADVKALQERVNAAYAVSMNAMLDLIKANPDEYATAYVIASGARRETEEGLRLKYDLLGESARATIPGKQIAAVLEQFARLKEGGEAPDFTVNKPDGNVFTLHGVPAKFKLLYFWESLNAGSRQPVPELVKLYLQYRPQGLEIVGISLDENIAYWRHAIAQDGMIWTNGSDLQGGNSVVASLYLVNDLPLYVLVDEENHIVSRSSSLTDVRKKLVELTKKKRKK